MLFFCQFSNVSMMIFHIYLVKLCLKGLYIEKIYKKNYNKQEKNIYMKLSFIPLISVHGEGFFIDVPKCSFVCQFLDVLMIFNHAFPDIYDYIISEGNVLSIFSITIVKIKKARKNIK